MHSLFHVMRVSAAIALLGGVVFVSGAAAQAPKPPVQQPPKPTVPPAPNGAAPATTEPPAYVIGADDILTIIVYGQDPMHSGDVVVRPDGKISRLMIEDVMAAGKTTAELKDVLTKAYLKIFQEVELLVTPKEIKSRRVFISGEVKAPGEFPLNQPMDIVQLISKAGGFQDWADKENLRLIRTLPNGKQTIIPFNYNKLFEAKGVIDIPQLQPGDRVIVK